MSYHERLVGTSDLAQEAHGVVEGGVGGEELAQGQNAGRLFDDRLVDVALNFLLGCGSHCMYTGYVGKVVYRKERRKREILQADTSEKG